jgi:hypothetical protein
MVLLKSAVSADSVACAGTRDDARAQTRRARRLGRRWGDFGVGGDGCIPGRGPGVWRLVRGDAI